MIIYCPFCGHNLPHPLVNGMSSCVNCCRVFDSSKQNQLLSNAWLVRKRDITDAEYLAEQYEIPKEDAELLIEYVADACYSHEDFLAFIQEKQKKAS
jgi:hypothetical protein